MLVRPYLAAAGHNDDHPMALGHELGDRPPGQQHLIVRMSMERNDRRHTRQPNFECPSTVPPPLSALAHACVAHLIALSAWELCGIDLT